MKCSAGKKRMAESQEEQDQGPIPSGDKGGSFRREGRGRRTSRKGRRSRISNRSNRIH